ncbi:hypothetical protein Tco_1476518 [Tanacetum coccineum]
MVFLKLQPWECNEQWSEVQDDSSRYRVMSTDADEADIQTSFRKSSVVLSIHEKSCQVKSPMLDSTSSQIQGKGFCRYAALKKDEGSLNGK